MIAFRFRASFAALAYLALLGSASAQTSTDYAVGPQYDSTHVYVEPGDFDRFVTSFIATFDGTASKQGVFRVTPTPSQTQSQIVATPVGIVSVFGFKTPVPYPFGEERTGYLVSDIDAAVGAAVSSGATRLVDTFPDPIGRDVLIQWPGGVNMQLYWHTVKPNYPALATVPENRIYLTADAADAFVSHWLAFSHGKVVSDDARAPGVEVGRPADTIRRIRISSGFGALVVFVSDGKIPWPYGRDLTGYEVGNLEATLAKAKAAGVEILVPPYAFDGRRGAIVRFPGGYIAEIHASNQ
jgi:hypothetical protein